MWVHELAGADARCGGKAVGLARLLAAQLPVPDGFVVDDNAFRHIVGELAIDDHAAIGHVLAEAAQRIASTPVPEELERTVRERTASLGVVAVRSSATIEDGVVGAAAGVFSSRTAVPAADVWDAIRAVWTSALTPLAASYARRRGGTIAIGVIVQRFVPGESITVYTRPPGRPGSSDVFVQRAGIVTRYARTEIAGGDAELALHAEMAIGAESTGADVEIVDGMIVQARPIVHPATRNRTTAPPTVTGLLVADGRRWAWDVAHNPDPLSTAQAELVERVDRAEVAPWSLRVCSGFLYSAPREDRSMPTPPLVVDETGIATHVVPIEQRIATILDTPAEASLGEVVDRYVKFYAIWATELGPIVAAAKHATTTERRGFARPSSVETALVAAARGEIDEDAVIERIGAMAPAWDVAVPTYGERRTLVRDAIARAKAIDVAREPTSTTLDVAGELAERDDLWFARAQWLVRRALLARGASLGLDPDDVFWLAFDVLEIGLGVDDARRRAAAARAAVSRAARWDMPLVVGGGQTVSPGPPLHGVGTGPRVTGRVVRFASLASAVAVGAGDIVVTRAVTPALAVLVIGCAALVSETGGLLDHGAALARELGIPCVVGCTNAWSLLVDQELVTVDGEAGTVTIVGMS